MNRAGTGSDEGSPVHYFNAEQRGSASPSGKPSLTMEAAGVQITRDGISWHPVGFGTPQSVSYSFRANAPASMPGDTTGFSRFSNAQIAAAEASLQAWADVANITFNRVGGTGFSDAGQIRFANYSAGESGAAAFAYYPADGDVWINSSISANQSPNLLSYGRQTLLHELGHSIGMQHPGDYDAGEGSPTYENSAEYYEDTRQFSVMSYWAATNTGADLQGYHSSAPLLDDITAVQRLYGANTATRAGDTTYGFGSTAGRDYFAPTGSGNVMIFAVWDAGGTDVFNFSGYNLNAIIDLQQGHFSSVGGLSGNIAVARGVVIENAVGGTNSDVIIGNAASNRLEGNGGSDAIYGLEGDDTLISGAGGAPVLFIDAGIARGSQASAINLNGYLSRHSTPTITSSTSESHATVRATANGTADWFSIIVANATMIRLDVDGASFDSLVTLYSSSGVQLSQNDDSSTDTGSPAGASGGTSDSALNYSAAPGTYFIRVVEYETTGIPANATYTLNVSAGNEPVSAQPLSGSILNGGPGNDILIGGLAPDTMIGGTGDDSFTPGSAATRIIEAEGEGTDTILINAAVLNYQLPGGLPVEILTASAGTQAINIAGNSFSQVINGNSGNNILSTGSGAPDTLNGGLGDDTYRVFATGDVINDTGGFDTVYTSGTSYFLYSTASVEYLSTELHTGTDAFYLVGNGASQVIIGNYGANILNGRGGDGNALADTLIGLNGDDVFGVFLQADVVRETAGGGVDVIFANTDYQLRDDTEIEALSAVLQTSTLASERYTLRGNAFAQWMVGNDTDNVLDGRGGTDVLIGRGGNDVFAFTTAPGADNLDIVQDFAPGDRIGLASDVFAAVTNGGILAGEFVPGTAAADADDRLLYDQATGRLYYDADGNGAGGAAQFAQFAAGTALGAAEFLVVPPVSNLAAA